MWVVKSHGVTFYVNHVTAEIPWSTKETPDNPSTKGSLKFKQCKLTIDDDNCATLSKLGLLDRNLDHPKVVHARVLFSLGGKFYKIRPLHSFSTQLTSGIVILAASFLGVPVSTSQVVSSAIIGVGSSERWGKVRWSVAGDIVTAWLITIPASALLSAGFYWLITTFAG